MKLLFILEDNFPESGACTSLLNNLLFTGGLADNANSIEVLSVKNQYTPLKMFRHNGITVHNAVMMSRISVEQYKQLIFKHPLKALKGIFNKLFVKASSNAVNHTNAKYIECEINKINADEFDAIIAVMGYFDVAAAAMRFKEKNPDTALILYQVDPCASNESFHASTKSERISFEKKLYEVSDRIITTPILLKEAKSNYPEEIIAKMVPMEFPNVVPVKDGSDKSNDVIRCLFTGSIYGKFRDPQYTLRLFDKTDPLINFEVIGSVKPEVKSEFAQHSVLYHGSKPLEETKAELAKADVLVNIGNDMLNQVPSKLFEYISYGKPIINICKNRNCPTLRYLSEYPYALNLYEEEEIFEEQVKILNEFILNNNGKRILPDDIINVYKKCTPQYCANQMLEIIESIGK